MAPDETQETRVVTAGRYPAGAVETALTTLEAVRPDYPAGSVLRNAIDDALDRLYRFREIEAGVEHPYRARREASDVV